MEIDKKELREKYKNRICTGGVYCIKCKGNSDYWLRSATDLQGAKNRFEFSVKTNSCLDLHMKKDWALFGPESFVFDVLEEIQKKETQTNKEFASDVAVLLELWLEKTKEE